MASSPMPWRFPVLLRIQPPWYYFIPSAIVAPIAILSKVLHFHNLAVFFLNLFALIPLSAFLRDLVREIVWWFQLCPPRIAYAHTLGGLLDCLFGNAPDLIFAITALSKNQTTIVQTAITGSILSSSLFVLGICFIVGGWQKDIKNFPRAVARTHTQLLMIALGSLVLPIAYESWSDAGKEHSAALSHATAIVLLCLYCCHFWFFFGTHAYLSQGNRGTVTRGVVISGLVATAQIIPSFAEDTTKYARHIVGNRNIRPFIAFGIAIVTAAVLTLSCIFMVDVIDAPFEYLHISKSFTGLIILPLFLSATEYVIAATHAHRQEMDWVIQATVVSNTRISLFVLPTAVLFGWILGIQGMTIFFDGFQVVLVFISVFLINMIFHGGDGQWIQGSSLLSMFGALVFAAWFYPNNA